MADPATTKMVIASELTEVPRVQQAILDKLQAHGYDKDTVFAVRLAIEEALSNAIRHGNCDDPAKQVTIEYTVTAETVRISVTDEGCGFEPDALPDPCAEENLARPHGRGVMLMQAYMNEVTYNNAGNCVTMVRHRDSPPPAASNSAQ